MARDHDHFKLFDGLRALAATSVFAMHLWVVIGFGNIFDAIETIGREPFTRLSETIINLGYFGVGLFYVISAFLLYRPFYKARVMGHERPNVRSYLIRRAVRILPAYWVALTLIGLADSRHDLFTLHGIVEWYGLLFIYRSGPIMWDQILPAWTICVEATFYLFLPVWAYLIGSLTRRARNRFAAELMALGGLALFSVVWKIVVLHNLTGVDSSQRAMVALPASLDVFAAGMALAVVSVRLEDAIRSGRLPRILRMDLPWWIFAFVLFQLLCFLVGGSGPFTDDVTGKALTIHLLKIPVCVAVVIPAVFAGSRSRGAVRSLLGNRFVQWVGMVSYGLFLWHVFVLQHLKGGGPLGLPALFPDTPILEVPLAGAVAYAIALGIAALSWRLVERPALHRGRHWAKRIEQSASKPVPAS